MSEGDDFPYAHTHAAQMLRSGINKIKVTEGKSARTLAKELGYRQSVVLSHMASGRVAVPLERALDFARALHLDEAEFLMAAVEQKVPGAKSALDHSGTTFALSQSFTADLALIAGMEIASLPDGTKRILREVVADPDPSRRWLSLAELPTVMLLRKLVPALSTDGLSTDLRSKLEAALTDAC